MTARQDLPETPSSIEEVVEGIKSLLAGVADSNVSYGPNSDGYGKAVEAMTRAAYLAHEYVARELGVTGFQHSISALTIVGMLNRIEGPYMLIDLDKALYPQYNLVNQVEEFIFSTDSRTWLADEAEKKLADSTGAVENVVEHWKDLVADRPAK